MNDCCGTDIDDIFSDSLIHTSSVLLVLLYADDTVLNAINYDMQKCVNVFNS